MLRYRPPAPMVPQVAMRPFKLTDSYTAPRGAFIIPDIVSACHQGFTTATEFDPDRFRFGGGGGHFDFDFSGRQGCRGAWGLGGVGDPGGGVGWWCCLGAGGRGCRGAVPNPIPEHPPTPPPSYPPNPQTPNPPTKTPHPQTP